MVALDEEGAHPSIHYEIRLSLSQLCGVREKKPPLQLLSSGQCAPHSFGVEGHSLTPSGAQHRGLAPSWCRHDAADSVAKAASDGFALVEAEICGDLSSFITTSFLVVFAFTNRMQVPEPLTTTRVAMTATVEKT